MRILVIGDAIWDVFRDLRFKKFCPDAPDVPAGTTFSLDCRPGGAANVALNVAALDPTAHVDLISVLTTDAARAVKYASKNRISLDYCHDGISMIQKERVILDGKTLVRVDSPALTGFDAEQIEARLRFYLSDHDPDIIIFSDYSGGTVGGASLERLLTMREKLIADTKMLDLSPFDGSFLLKLNMQEWKNVVQREAIPERFFRYMVVTDGARGSELTVRRQSGSGSLTHTLRVPAVSVDAVDVCGAGDTYVAALAVDIMRHGDPFSAMVFASAAASTVVSQPRTAVADRDKTLLMLGRES